MVRRAIQASAYEKGAPDKKLREQLDWLAAREIITKQMAAVAHKIRLGGNSGAHPDLDGVKDVQEADARALLTFLEDFIKYVYEIPQRLEGLSSDTPT